MAAFKAKYKYDLGVPKTWKELGDIAEFFHRPTEKRYGITIYTDNSYDALVMGVENVLFSYGGELGDYATNKVAGIINSKENIEALNFYKKLYGYTPPDWGKTFFQEANQAMTEGLVAMSMNYFAFFPALANPATNKYAKQTGYFAMPKGPTGKQFAALGGQGISVVTYSKNKEASMKFLEWFVKEDVQKKWAELGGYTCNAAILKSDAFRKATPYNEAFYQSMFMVKDFWAVPWYAELLTAANKRWHPFVVGGKGTAKEAMDGLEKDWAAIFKKYAQEVATSAPSARRRHARRARIRCAGPHRTLQRLHGRAGRTEAVRSACANPIRIHGTSQRRPTPARPSPRRGMSDLAIRNWFIIPTLVFLIVFNIFPLLYSLGYSFTDYRASMNDPVELRRAAELPRAAGRRDDLEQLHAHREVRVRLGGRAR